MIKSFKDKTLELCWREGKCKGVRGDLKRRVLMKLDLMDAAKDIEDLKHPPSNHLHSLHGDLKGCWAISVSGAWRLVFKEKEGDIFDVMLLQYH